MQWACIKLHAIRQISLLRLAKPIFFKYNTNLFRSGYTLQAIQEISPFQLTKPVFLSAIRIKLTRRMHALHTILVTYPLHLTKPVFCRCTGNLFCNMYRSNSTHPGDFSWSNQSSLGAMRICSVGFFYTVWPNLSWWKKIDHHNMKVIVDNCGNSTTHLYYV